MPAHVVVRIENMYKMFTASYFCIAKLRIYRYRTECTVFAYRW
jgi:hypothetical protein